MAETLQTITYGSGGHQERGGSKVAAEALTHLIGDVALVDAVNHSVPGRPGAELARSVLAALRPFVAMQRCHAIFLAPDDEQSASIAINLLQAIADRRVLPWIAEYLASSSVGVRVWGLGIVDQLLLMTEEIELSEAMPLIQMGLNDADPHLPARPHQLLEMVGQTTEVPHLPNRPATLPIQE